MADSDPTCSPGPTAMLHIQDPVPKVQRTFKDSMHPGAKAGPWGGSPHGRPQSGASVSGSLNVMKTLVSLPGFLGTPLPHYHHLHGKENRRLPA